MPAYRVIYESMQAQLARIGIKMDIKVVDVAFRPTADSNLTQFLHSDSIVVTGKSPNVNFAHYDRIDSKIEAARNETDSHFCPSRGRA